MSNDKPRCQGKCRTFWGNCDRKPTVVRDGKHYCWTHDPERLEREALEKRKQRREELKRQEEIFELKLKRRLLVEQAGTRDLTNAELALIVELGGIRAMLQQLWFNQED